MKPTIILTSQSQYKAMQDVLKIKEALDRIRTPQGLAAMFPALRKK